MRTEQLESFERFVRGSLVASNYIRKSVIEGIEFKKLAYIDTLVDWICEESGFDGDVVFEAMEKFYNQMREDYPKTKSLLETLLINEYKVRLNENQLQPKDTIDLYE